MSFADYEWAAEYLPIFGERFPVEFANSRYLHGSEVIDFLGTDDLIRLWFERAPEAADRRLPSRITRAFETDLRDLRDATHHLLHALARPNSSDGVAGNASTIATLNRHAASAPSHLRLSWEPGTSPEARTKCSGGQLDVLLAEIASTCIEFIGGPEAKLVRCCSGNGCSLLFVQNHHKRRFCHESCSHRTRQARYYQSTLTRTPS
jgi:predicted RNA-binding Zn ribbon-like protein